MASLGLFKEIATALPQTIYDHKSDRPTELLDCNPSRSVADRDWKGYVVVCRETYSDN